MEPIGAAFEGRAGEIAYAPPRLPVISNLTGVPLETVSAAYWRAHMRQAVRFSQGLDALWALGCDVLIEVGPRPVLIQLARQGASSAKVPGAEQPRHRYLTSLKGPGTDEWDALCQAVQELYAAGAELDWAGWNRDYRRRKIDAPSYPFERRRHWISPSVGKPGQVRGRVGGPIRCSGPGCARRWQAANSTPTSPSRARPPGLPNIASPARRSCRPPG